MLESLKRFQNAKSLNDLFTLMTLKELDVLAAFPLTLFFISPVIVFWQITIINTWRYEMTVGSLRMITVIFSIIVLTCDFAKQHLSGSKLRDMVSEHKPKIWFILMAVLIMISTFINGFTQFALEGDYYRGESVFGFLSYILCFYGCASTVRYERTKRFLMNSFLIAAAFTSIMALLDMSGIMYIWHFHPERQPDTLTGVFYQYNHFGYYLAIAVTISFAMYLFEDSINLKFLYLLSVALQTLTLIINNTRGCYLACLGAVILTCLVYLKTRKPKISTVLPVLAVFAVSVVTGFIVIPQNLQRFLKLFRDVSDLTASAAPGADEVNTSNAGTGRWLLWKLTVGAIIQKPLFGWGTEGICNLLALNSIDGNNRPHNEFLQYAAFYGIPASLTYIAALVSIYRRAYSQLSKLSRSTVAALLGGCAYLISSCFGNTMFYTAPFLFILLGLGFRSESKD